MGAGCDHLMVGVVFEGEVAVLEDPELQDVSSAENDSKEVASKTKDGFNSKLPRVWPK
ncbi:MAG TPA: hypothetical protein VGS27_05535 [Candidatus Sulfotelmatobacter sp.]|nr:hypothetical protein [Candidatus Sulfotelmatobacter sp.]